MITCRPPTSSTTASPRLRQEAEQRRVEGLQPGRVDALVEDPGDRAPEAVHMYSSRANALTMRIPEMFSSASAVSSAIRCWTSCRAGREVRVVERADAGARRRGHVRASARPRLPGAAAGAVRRLHGLALQPDLAAGAAGGPAADRRADRRGRGVGLGSPRRQGVRPRGAHARPLPQPGQPGLRPERLLDPPARLLQPADRVPAEPRAGGRAARRRPAGDQRHRSRSATSPPSTPTW